MLLTTVRDHLRKTSSTAGVVFERQIRIQADNFKYDLHTFSSYIYINYMHSFDVSLVILWKIWHNTILYIQLLMVFYKVPDQEKSCVVHYKMFYSKSTITDMLLACSESNGPVGMLSESSDLTQ
jgi:hypothetical protein